MSSPKLVYSTGQKAPEKDKNKTATKTHGPSKMRLESSGRGGKTVTVLFNLPFTASEAKAHMKSLQSIIGTGATYKEGRIEIQGDRCEAVSQYFGSIGLKLIRAGA